MNAITRWRSWWHIEMALADIITFTSDFGDNDGYVGIVKGSIMSVNDNAKVIDVCHAIEPFNIVSAAWVIYNAFNYFPKGTIHVVVVDPGVGSTQRRIALKTSDYFFVGPDNGVFSLIVADPLNKRGLNDKLEAFHLTNPQFFLPEVSSTFHARDIFGPVAGYLSLGMSCTKMGEEIEISTMIQKSEMLVEMRESGLVGRVVHIDRFGNLITNIPASLVHQNWNCSLGENEVPLSDSYHSVPKGELLAITGSHGFVEIAMNEGNAAEEFNVATGATVRLDAVPFRGH